MSPVTSRIFRWLGVIPGWPGRVETGLGKVVLLSATERDPAPPILGCERLVVVSDRGARRTDRRVQQRVGHGHFVAGLRTAAGDGAREAIVHDLEHASFGDVLGLARVGVHRIHFTYAAGASFRVPVATALLVGAWCSARNTVRRLTAGERGPLTIGGWVITPPRPSRVAVRKAFAGAIREEPIPRWAERATPRRIAHYISDLASGGAQRQLVELARAQHASGHEVSVYTMTPIRGSSAHFAAELSAMGVTVASPSRAGRLAPPRDLHRVLPHWPAPLVALLHDHPARARVAWLVRELAALPAEVLHCWLDEPNAIGALAGIACGARRIVLSTRNLSPRVSPRFARTWFRTSYRLAARATHVRFIANSRAGAADYARWSGISRDRFTVIPNGVDLHRFKPLSSAERARVRAELGIDEHTFLVAGVLRLTVEKRPLDFVDTIARLCARVPEARAIHIGAGAGAADVRARASALEITGKLRFMGAATSPERYLAAADACLLTSEFEGCPNVALESQALGIPIVVTDGGGSPEVVRDGETGFVAAVGDVDSMVSRLHALARDPARRDAMGRRGRIFVSESFSIDRMVHDTMLSYR